MRLSCAVALATYNGELFLKRQLQSLMNQTRKIDKVYICDDCSTDGTAELIRSFIQENLLWNWDFEIQKQNVGCRLNFSSAITKCKEDIIFLCDQDDIWLDNKIEVMMDVFEKYEKVQSLICGFKLIDQNDNFVIRKDTVDNLWFHDFHNETHGEPRLYKAELASVLGHNIGPGCAQAFRKDLIPLYTAFNCARLYHDYKLSLAAAMSDGLYFWNEALVHYRTHGNNTIGVPRFYILRRNNPISVPFYYIRMLVDDALYLVSRKHRSRLIFDMTDLIHALDAMPLADHLQEEYREWKAFCGIRTKLYSAARKKNPYRKLQHSTYKKHYQALSYTNDPIENFQIFIKDLCVLLKH